MDQFKKTIEIDPNYASAHDNLARTYRDMGKYDLWVEEWKKSATLANDQEELAISEETARVYTKGGFRAALNRIIELRKQLAQRRYVDPADIAYAYAELGGNDQVFYWLEKAYSEKPADLQFVKVAKPMDPFPFRSALHQSVEAHGPAALTGHNAPQRNLRRAVRQQQPGQLRQGNRRRRRTPQGAAASPEIAAAQSSGEEGFSLRLGLGPERQGDGSDLLTPVGMTASKRRESPRIPGCLWQFSHSL